MNSWQRWVKAPYTTSFRRILFQVHLWTGIGLGLYILVISVSGSAVVLRPQINRWFIHNQVESTNTDVVSETQIELSVSNTYPDSMVKNIRMPTVPGRAIYVLLEKNGQQYSRYFDHYQNIDLGPTYPWQVQIVEWLTRLHDDLLMGRQGRKVNAAGGAILMLMVMSGLVIWWQGKRRWTEGIKVSSKSPRSLWWQLHSFIGFWLLLLMFSWGLTAVYFGFPEPFNDLIDWLDDDLNDFDRPDGFLLFLIDLHFGRFRGSWLAYLWVILGLLPGFMFISGFVLWYKRIVNPRSDH